MNKFKNYCKVTRFFNLLDKSNVCQPIIAGGYGIIETLKEYKLNPTRLKTKDIDIHLNIRGSNYENNPTGISWVIEEFKKSFCEYKKIDMKTILHRVFKINSYIPVEEILNVKIYNLHVVVIDNIQFDFVITNEPRETLLKSHFNKTGLPLKTRKAYKEELFGMMVRELIKDVNTKAYTRRNPISGENKSKGVENMKRLEKLCGKSRYKQCRAANMYSIYKKKKNSNLLSKEMQKYYFSIK